MIRHHTIGLRSDLHAELDALPPTGRPQLNIQQDDRMSGSAAEPPSTVAWQEALDIDAEVLQWSADNEGEAGVEALSIHTPNLAAAATHCELGPELSTNPTTEGLGRVLPQAFGLVVCSVSPLQLPFLLIWLRYSLPM